MSRGGRVKQTRPGAPVVIAAAVVRDLPPMTLAQDLECYTIEEPIDFVALREAWQDEAAKAVIGE